MPLSLQQLRENSLALLGKTLVELFPKLQLLHCKVTDHGFYYDVIPGDQKIDYEVLRVIEERMYLAIHEKIKFKHVEMLRDNAIAYLRHHKFFTKAKILEKEHSPGIMSFLQVGTIMEPLVYEEVTEDVSELKALKILSASPVPETDPDFLEEAVRIKGTTFFDSQELKLYLKKRARYSESYHLDIGRESGFCAFTPEGNHIWLSKGIDLMADLRDYAKENFDKIRVEQIQSGASTEEELVDDAVECLRLTDSLRESPAVIHEGLLYHSEDSSDFQGLWRSPHYFSERCFFASDPSDLTRELISSLQFIEKKGKIFCSESFWVLPDFTDIPSEYRKKWEKKRKNLIEALDDSGISYIVEKKPGFNGLGPRVYLTYSDVFGKKWKGPFVGVEFADIKGKPVIVRSVFGSFERCIAYLLESNRGIIPTITKQ